MPRQLTLFENEYTALTHNLLTVSEASVWASNRVGREITPSNISYLIQYGHIRKLLDGGVAHVSTDDLESYYSSYDQSREQSYKSRLGDDINWELSFSQVKEAESTKHVHRLHPYKGKFIPQLVEYFIGGHTDAFKRDVYFKRGDIILDPFSGSGTTLIQACECGINAIGIDVSAFNALIANCKLNRYDLYDLQTEISRITDALKEFISRSRVAAFEERLIAELKIFNNEFFPVPEYKYRLRQKEIDEKQYARDTEARFLPVYNALVREYDIKLRQENDSNFLEKWFSQQVRDEIDFVFGRICEVKNNRNKKILTVILSRTMRSCRATTHSDLATLIEPVTSAYYCVKHGKICKPLFSIMKWWDSYCKDTVMRLAEFNKIRTDTMQTCITGDSRTVDIIAQLRLRNPAFADMAANRGINGIFSSPPYVGMIDYHEQHAYAYDLFGFKRSDDSEIGPMFMGKGKEARHNYADGITKVLLNCKRFFAEGYNAFLVANDMYNLYPAIAKNAGMEIVNTFRRPVLNRSEKDKTLYSESIFHMREKT